MDKKILVVDDYEGVVNLYRAALSQRGYRVTTAKNGSEAVERARDVHPDLVIMDVNLPDMDGLLAAFLLRSAPDTRDIPVLAMSTTSGTELRDEAIHLGCRAFLQKPFTLQYLFEEIERLLATRPVRVA